MSRRPDPVSIAAVYDDEVEEQYYQGYPSRPARRGPSIFASIVTSVLTTVAVFFGLRELDARGYLGGSKTGGGATGTAEVPNVVGVRLDQARELLKAKGLLISIAEEREDGSVLPGNILAQKPLAGSETQPGTTVQVTLARAVSTVIVPPTAGQKPEDAMRALAAKGLQAGPQKTAASDAVTAGLVIDTDPKAGSAVPPNTAISLVVATVPGKAVPNVIGKRLQRGKKMLEEAGFKLGKTKYTYDPCCGEYVILKQEPGEGATAPAGATIDVVVNEPG